MNRKQPYLQDLSRALSSQSSKGSKISCNEKETAILKEIRSLTEKNNRNNLTRTKAYYEYYLNHPEIKWALLAHLVSRNGGWNMTDLKGEFLSLLLPEKEQHNFFCFLERGNWLIFQDAYPQLLLYEKSLESGRSLFHLLPHLQISSFMKAMWTYFWEEKDENLLSYSLIINEQMYIEKRVIAHKSYQISVLNTMMFKLQDILNLNHLLIPYYSEDKKETKLSGAVLHHFASLEERIEFGKKLYAMIFSTPSKLSRITAWAGDHLHTGSRSDYWPQLFSATAKSRSGSLHGTRISACSLKENAPLIFSPTLSSAWKDTIQEKAERGDWFDDEKVLKFFAPPTEEKAVNIYEAYCGAIEKMERAVYIEKLFLHKDQQRVSNKENSTKKRE
ncbi:DUF2515 domain-containing protein [Halobacillus salinarum]|uniref:DUF2515 domain-containing protein n=1 Tax=Halobacillus salinarum TaxID=2932257 RepID=A0ABY4EF53_9BACI|nr:DUF2515 family protein [Halobacillus salinarum]UOQ43095.1 DUF2515 domain-containing protein [Halobacillus salinarum]